MLTPEAIEARIAARSTEDVQEIRERQRERQREVARARKAKSSRAIAETIAELGALTGQVQSPETIDRNAAILESL